MEGNEWLVTLPLAPSVNEAYREALISTRSGLRARRVATAALRNYKQEAGWMLREQLARQAAPDLSTKSSIGYEVVVYVLTAGSDLSNRLKAFEDVVSMTWGFNDNRIYELKATKRIDALRPRMEARIYLL